MNDRLRLPLLLAFILFFLAVSVIFLRLADKWSIQNTATNPVIYTPSPRYAKISTLGFAAPVASWIWLRTILYYADAYLTHTQPEQLPALLQSITALNPQFVPAYYFGGLLLCDDLATAYTTLSLLKNGIQNNPQEYRFRLFAGLCQLKTDSNYYAAADFLGPLAQNTQVPPYIQSLAIRMQNRGGNQEALLDYSLMQYFESKSPLERERYLDVLVNWLRWPGGKQNLRQNLQEIEEKPQNLRSFREVLLKRLWFIKQS